ncbi:MAG TPA: OmpA family protein [Rhizobacter sp.]|nr:OmpA family protein [Rhizobacter sp.]
MSAQDDEVQGYALGVVLALLGFVVAGVIGLVLYRQLHKPAAAPVATASVVGAVQRVYFELGQDSLPPQADEVLVRVADAARQDAQARVLISGFHDASGDAAANAELAKRRAQRVQHALEANGVATAQLQLSKPELTTGGADPREARRVDITVTSP